MQQKHPSLTLGFFAGALGGAIGTMLLNAFQKSSLKATEALEMKLGTDNTYSKQQKKLPAVFEDAHA